MYLTVSVHVLFIKEAALKLTIYYDNSINSRTPVDWCFVITALGQHNDHFARPMGETNPTEVTEGFTKNAVSAFIETDLSQFNVSMSILSSVHELSFF
jgi:hypothetical protein